MRVKIHPHRNKVLSGIEECISVTPDQKGGRAYYAGTVVLADVVFLVHRGEDSTGRPTGKSGLSKARKDKQRNVHAWAVGELIDQNACQHPLSHHTSARLRKVTYNFTDGVFTDFKSGKVVTRTPFLYAVGRDFYYLP